MKRIETNRIEYNRELTDELDIEKEVVAFLNYKEGGIIYVGIDNNGHTVGVRNIDGDMLKIKNRIRSNIMPSPMGLFDVTAETDNGVKIIKIFVASGSEKPYYKAKFGMSSKGCFIRVGSAAEPMTTTMIEDLFAHRVRNSLRRIRSPRQDLSFRQLHIYYESRGLNLNDNFAKNLELVTEDGLYNYVAYLLADENGNSIKLAKYSGKDRCNLISNNEYGYCSLLKAADSLLEKLNIENQVSSKITYPYRVDTYLWDKIAIRELVINALVHNDYSNEIPPKVEIFSDRLEITSAGHLPEGMDEEDFFGGVSNPRNKELMRVFRDVEMVEALGSGVPRVMQSYGRECFQFMNHFIRIVIPFTSHKDVVEEHVDKQENISKLKEKLASQNVVEDVVEKLTDRQRDIVELIKRQAVENVVENVVETSATLAKKLTVTPRTIQRDLEALQRLGIISHKGSDKGGYWEVNAKLH